MAGKTVGWQYPEQQAEFLEWYNNTPSWQEKQNTDNLIAFENFCKTHGHRPRVRNDNLSLDSNSAFEVTPEENELAKFGYTAWHGGIKFRHPEERRRFNKTYNKYPTWTDLLRKAS